MTSMIRWGSIDPIMGFSKTYPESAKIEQVFCNGEHTIFIDTFSITVHLREPFHQTTPRIGSKPKGYRSVFRGEVGQSITIYLWSNSRWYTTVPSDMLNPISKQVIIEEIEEIPEVWQWCDRYSDNTKYALARNWHNFPDEISSEIEEKSKIPNSSLIITIGLTRYELSNFEGGYGIQKNITTNMTRAIRRGRSKFVCKELEEHLQEESCCLCMEDFKDTLKFPRRTTSCNHTFHWSCLNNYKARTSHPRCPMCRAENI